jgi:uncharacterized protein YjbJ (UPF0337 family)
MLSHAQIEGKWTEIRAGVRNLWGKITEDEIDQYKNNLFSISSLVQERYLETHDSINKKLDKLMDSFDNETDKSLKLNDGESSYERNPTRLQAVDDEEIYDDFQAP